MLSKSYIPCREARAGLHSNSTLRVRVLKVNPEEGAEEILPPVTDQTHIAENAPTLDVQRQPTPPVLMADKSKPGNLVTGANLPRENGLDRHSSEVLPEVPRDDNSRL